MVGGLFPPRLHSMISCKGIIIGGKRQPIDMAGCPYRLPAGLSSQCRRNVNWMPVVGTPCNLLIVAKGSSKNGLIFLYHVASQGKSAAQIRLSCCRCKQIACSLIKRGVPPRAARSGQRKAIASELRFRFTWGPSARLFGWSACDWSSPVE